MPSYIVTVTTADRVGLVHAVTGSIRERGGNIVELSQTVMRGYFTLILAVDFPQAIDREALRRAIEGDGARSDLTVAVLADPGLTGQPVPGGERFILTVLGNDRPGSVHGIAGCLARRGVNIVDMHARLDADRFNLIMEVFLPPDLSPAEIRAELEDFGKELGLEAYVQHENIFLATTEPSPVRIGSAARLTEGSASVAPH